MMAKETSDVTFANHPKEQDGEVNPNLKPHSSRVPSLALQVNNTIAAPLPLSPLTTTFSPSRPSEATSATPASPTSATSPTTPFSPVSATSARSVGSAQSPISPTSPPPPLKPTRSPLRPMARSISNGSTAVLNSSPKPFPPTHPGTPSVPTANAVSARGSSSRTFPPASLPHSISSPNVSTPQTKPSRPRRPATPPPIDTSRFDNFEVAASIIDELEASVNPANRQLPASLVRRNTDGSFLIGSDGAGIVREEVEDKRKQRRLGQHLDGAELINNRVPVDDLNDSPVSIQFDRDIDYPEIDDEDEFSAEFEEHHRSIDAMLRPTLSRNTSALSSSSNVSNISHGSGKSVDLKKRDGPLPSTPSTTTLATVATTATGATATTPTRPKRISSSSTAPSTTPSTNTYASGASTAATTASTSTSGAPMTKRQHALHELLSSERAFASDLALVREVHIPLAFGQAISLPYPIQPASAGPSPSSAGIPPTPPLVPSSGSSSGSSSSGNSTRTVSVVSSSSGSESLISIGSAVSNPHTQAQQLPMTPEDARIIFSNLEEVAAFSDSLCELLETALGSAIPNLANEDSHEESREDHVGQLFLEIIPEMEKYYKQYIHKHPTALAHLHAMTAGTPAAGAASANASANSILTSLNPSVSSLSTGNGPSPALLTYLQTTSAIASQHSHAWDLPSLLIKPVQRFLKYPLLLQAILEETEDGHGDKERLKLAKMKMEESARSVNESRRRAEVVREVLMGKGSAVAGVKGVALSAGVNLGKMKSLKVGNGKRISGNGKDAPGAASTPTLLPSSSAVIPKDPDVVGNAEAKQVEILKEELKRIEAFAQTFAKNVVDWAKMMGNMIRALRMWSVAFGKVIGLTVTPFNATGTTGSGGSFSDAASSISGSQGEAQSSEAFDAFLTVIESQLTPLCATLESVVNDRVLKDIARLLATMNQPLKLIASMDSQAPFHHHLLTMTIGPKSRPSPALLAASQNYLALRGQLAAELPTYLKLLHKGLGGCIVKLADVQVDFWRDVKARWSELWDMLRVEGEMNAGHEETVRVWIGRWADVEVVLSALKICQPIPPSSNPPSKRNTQEPPPKERKYSNASSLAGVGLGGAYPGAQSFVPPVPAAMSPSFAPLMPNYEPPSYAQAYATAAMTIQATNLPSSPPSSPPGPTTPPTPAAAKVMGILGGLDPSHAPTSNGISGPLPLQPKGRPRGASDVSGKHPSASSTSVNGSSGSGGGSSIFSGKTSVGSIKRKTSMESLRSTVASVHTVKPTPSVRRNDSHTRKKSGDGGFFDFVSFGNQQPPRGDMSRTKSMPLTVERSNSHKSSSSQEALLQEQYEQQYQQQEVAERGRNTLRKPNSLKQKFTESFRGSQQPPSSSRQRSTSKGNATYFPDDPEAPPLPAPLSPRKNIAFQQQQQQYYNRPDSWADRKGKYVCRVIHACKPPHAAFYYSYPFFTLIEGDLYEVLQEVGHPSMHPKLPLYVDDGEDCLLLCRDGYKNVGWALASFLEPIELEGW